MNVAHERRFRADVVSEYDGCVHNARHVAQRMLSRWDDSCGEFVKVFPIDYKRVLEEQARRERDEAPIAA